MSARSLSAKFRTWIEIDSAAARVNYGTFRRLIGPRVKLWAVVKSNAYGHGLFVFSKLMDRLGADGFCVDSLVEGVNLRKAGIRKPILVLGPTLPGLLPQAARHDIAVTVSNREALRAWLESPRPPECHFKVDTGMHRQGFYPAEMPGVLEKILKLPPPRRKKATGIYTHFAAAADLTRREYAERQFSEFMKVVEAFRSAGLALLAHCAATGGVLLDKKYHLDAVRIGKGMYGFFPSPELERQLPGVRLSPVLSWRTVVTEVKELRKGDAVGYDLTERVTRPTSLAILPVGYWHGLPRILSSKGEALIRGRRAKILGRISMDLTAVDAGRGPCRPGDIATLIGKDGKASIDARRVAAEAGTITYELLTRLNPLIERVIV